MKQPNNSDSLNDRIEYLTKLYTTYRADISERETLAYAVLPILRNLDWDDSKIEEMKFEYPVGAKKVDIALLLPSGNKIFIEAKAFQASLSRRDPGSKKTPREQLFEYCHAAGVQRGVLTNGREWRVYEREATNSQEMDLRLKINLIKDDRDTVIKNLNQFLWKERVEKASFEATGNRKTARSSTEMRPFPSRRPKTIKVFWRKRKVNSWREIMLVFLAEAHKRKPEEFINAVRRRPKRFVESSEKPNSIKSPLQIPGSNVWVSGHAGAKMLWGVCESMRIALGFSEKVLRCL